MKITDCIAGLRWFQYSPELARVFTPTGSILLCWMLWKMRDVGGEVEARIDEIEEATGLSTKNITTARDRLKGILMVRERRIEHRTFYSVDHEELQRQWDVAQDEESRETPKRHLVRNAETASREEPKRQVVTREQEQGRRTEEQETPMAPLAGGNPSTRRRSIVQPSPEAKAMVQAFATVYALRFRRSYAPDPREDVKAAHGLLERGLTAELVSETFDAATRAKGWWCGKVTTLPGLAKNWNEVGAELAKQNGGRNGMAADGIGTSEEWAESLREEPK